tara:strand:- start:2730 stop:2930 length:201 start_codon:yes stop_codon:yes gene_type:complete
MDVVTFGMNKAEVTLEEMDSNTQILTISFKEDDGGDVEFRMYSGTTNHFKKSFLKLFNIKMEKTNA